MVASLCKLRKKLTWGWLQTPSKALSKPYQLEEAADSQAKLYLELSLENDGLAHVHRFVDRLLREERSPSGEYGSCAVCGESKLRSEFLPSGSTVTKRCRHGTYMCIECLQTWIETQLNSVGWHNIKCPESDCEERLEHADVHEWATAEAFQR